MMYFQSSDIWVLWPSCHHFCLLAFFSNIATLPWMLVMWSSYHTIFVETGSSKWTLNSAVTFDAVVLWFWYSPFQYTVIPFTYFWFLVTVPISWWCLTMICVGLHNTGKCCSDTGRKCLVADAQANRAPTVCSVWKSDKYFHMDCY